ncbi:GAF domain-containing protein [Leptospira interrogans]|uniref:Response regulator with HD-GYP domain n=1 Tax=Leptospira interrogans serovar Hardjo str. Norma TaxID=1279460 RepID=A0A0M4NWF4_LEPIR|nr:HD domain-containing phosphohydrolase [Leptospira interrogans]ALE38292.1 response regulator with HD-GYP domain [Leptospira interrogans serovar Hardjo str. Norma]ALO01132.1 HD family phosphohydrolase [Leptospira interrogans serovar Hardjo-prajitno]EKO96886.1 GAF domain protein [Leptospira interrogans str. Brem 329]EKR19482.1 GAF domain protein [Leptospira interrogans serovar Pyrogenes str. 2006006960]MCD1165556.1 GAF domain-containing protein [Leptospira interrogans]
MKSKFPKYIVTDLDSIVKRLGPIISRLEIEFLDFKEFFQSELFRNSSGFLNVIFYLTVSDLKKTQKEIHQQFQRNPLILSRFILNENLDYVHSEDLKIEEELIFSVLPESSSDMVFNKTFLNAFTQLQMITDQFDLQHKVNTTKYEISKLTRVGISLADEKDINKLLREIIFSAREIAIADSGSLYLVEKDELGLVRNLRFKISSMDIDTEEFLLPINKSSVAGYVAATGKILNIPDVYNLPEDSEYKFNRNFDVLSNYHTKSMLVVPMKNHRNEVVGVIQLINKKRNFNQKLTLEQMRGNDVFPFDDYSAQLVMGVAGQAAVAIQNNHLLQEIEALFEGFVTASVNAIESRDPTTSGHSFRVAVLTVGLAETVDLIREGKYKNTKFSKEQIKEIRYASLLHDFGKVGVREKVLVKSKKLEDYELELIRWRFEYIKKDIESRILQKKTDYLKKHGAVGFADYETSLEFELKVEYQKLDQMFQIVVDSNEPSILEESNFQKLEEIAKVNYSTTGGEKLSLISPYEFGFLTIKKGSLDFAERKEIESHVEHTFQFLSKIPWTGDLKMVPSIAHAHHEKLDGTGYPRGLTADSIPIQSKIMAISDIFDALTDKDRPYKRAVPIERALDILQMEARENHVDQDLLKIFIEGKVYDKLYYSGYLR